MGWIIYAVVVLAVSGLTGMHLGRFREVYTEMLGMMVGMTMGMLNGFLLGYAAAAVTNSMFWGNLVGILLGLALGVYFGRPGGLMGVMDGSMGGVMGGSMGAMLAVMLTFPRDAQAWTGVLLGGIYVMGMTSLVVLIERSAPGHAAFHRLTPFLARAISIEISEAARNAARYSVPSNGRSKGALANQNELDGQGGQRRLINYYALLGISQNASKDDISEAYLEKIDDADDLNIDRLERALAVLTNSQRRDAYDIRLAESQAILNEPLVDEPQISAGVSALSPGRTGNQTTVTVASRAPVPPRVPKGSLTARPATGTSHAPGNPQNGRGTQPTGSAGGSEASAGSGQTDAPRRAGPPQRQRGSARGPQQNKGGGQGQSSHTAQKQQARYASAPQQRRSSPISWVGGLAAVVILVVLGWWVMTAAGGAGVGGTLATGSSAAIQSGASGQTLAQLDAQAIVAPVGADGKQTMNVVLDSATFQYKPSVIKVKQGVPVHFNLSVINGDPG